MPSAVFAKALARIIHDGSSGNRAVATRDRRAEPRGSQSYLKQCVDRPSGEPACLDAHHCVQACRSGESAIAAEALMNNAGYVKTVVEMGWGRVKNGALLALAANKFDAFLTLDKNLP